MPLYADDQKVFDAEYEEGTDDVEAVSAVKLDNAFVVTGRNNGRVGYVNANGELIGLNDEVVSWEDNEFLGSEVYSKKDGKTYYYTVKAYTTLDSATLPSGYTDREVKDGTARYYVGTTRYKTEEAFLKAAAKNPSEAYITVDLKKVEGKDESVGKPVVDEKVAYGNYTGNIDKNWSINLIEASTGVAELIEKAELYRATATDYASYNKYTDEIMPNAVYLKVTLKKEWKTTDSETMKYYVYVAKNNGSTKDKTNEVWVSGKYENTAYEWVNFDWTNNANEAKLWKVRKGENGTAVFDFADKAFFTVKMYSGESMYLDLSTAYDKTVAGEMDVEADSFYKFDNDNANFSRSGELVIVSDDDSLVPYSIEDGELVKVDAEYVENYAIAHTNTKVNGFVFKTKQLGNYVLATEEIAAVSYTHLTLPTICSV